MIRMGALALQGEVEGVELKGACQYLWDGCHEYWSSSITVVPGRRKRTSGHKLKQERFWLYIRRHFSPIRTANHWIELFREVVQCSSLEVFKTLSKTLGNQVRFHSCCWVPFQPESSCNSIWKRFSLSSSLLQVTNSECDCLGQILFSVKNVTDKVWGDRKLHLTV